MRDIAIVGGGPVGLCAALALQHPGRSVSVIEAGDLENLGDDGLNARSLALAASSVQIFRALGVWQALEKHAAPIRHIHVSARGRWGVTRLHASDYAIDALGYVVEYNPLCRCLLDAVAASPAIELQQNAEFEQISQQQSVDIEYRQQSRRHRLQARLALIADGARSRARAALGIDCDEIDYGQAVLICNVETSKPQRDHAYERFTHEGPLAMLPLGGKRYACVWTRSPQAAQAACNLPDAEFADTLQRAFGFRLGAIERIGARFSIPIRRVRAHALQRGRCLLLGNAANALHPVAGQSFNLSLRDLACLYELLAEHPAEALQDAAIEGLGTAYEAQRRREQNRVIRYGDGLVSMFSNELPVVDQLRALGLGLLDLAPALKAQAAFTGMGMSFGGNRLLRGHL